MVEIYIGACRVVSILVVDSSGVESGEGRRALCSLRHIYPLAGERADFWFPKNEYGSSSSSLLLLVIIFIILL